MIIQPKNKRKTAAEKLQPTKFTVHQPKVINLAVFGHGQVGSTLINQILKSAKSIKEKKDIKLNIFAIANSKKVLLNKNGKFLRILK